jgi:hypothetical protein
VAVGLKNPKAQFLAVWRLAGESTVSLPNPEGVAWKLLYPRDLGIRVRQASGKIQVCFPEKHMGAVLTNL